MSADPASRVSVPAPDVLCRALNDAVPGLSILAREEDRAFFSSDVYSRGETAALVIAPATVDALQTAVKLCVAQGYAVIGRGGGLSYTSGYLPVHDHSVIVDLSRLTRIVEINSTDMYVTVEAGCTWKDLYSALKSKGLRTPYFGPMSGYVSTVGGAMSQGSVFLGSTAYGTSAESVLSLDVILSDGSILSTGSAAGLVRPSPFFRTHGPDLTGLFLNDSGAFGIKARVTLALIPLPPHSRFAAFTYETAEDLLHALAAVSRSGLAAECFGTDPYVQSRRIHEQNLGKDLAYFKAVATSGETLLSGVGAAARMAWKGRRSLGGESYVLNITLDEASPEAADANMRLLRGLASRGAIEIEATIPRAIRSLPFTYPNDILGDRGERWVPTHALAPHSRAVEVVHAIESLFSRREQVLEDHGIEWGYLVFAVGARATLIEPLFYWPDSRAAYHERMIQPDFLARLPRLPSNPAATAAVRALRTELIELFAAYGCPSLQLGKTYPFLETRQPPAAALLRSLKAATDPDHQMNPGALGLERR